MSQPRFIFMTLLCQALLVLLFLQTHCSSMPSVDLNLLSYGEMMDGVNVMTKRVCRKSIGECLLAEAESESEKMMMMMDSERSRRVLAAAMQRRYISYETLKRDMVPCDRPGASYYNCHARQANPYNRGCEVITGCARGVQGVKT